MQQVAKPWEKYGNQQRPQGQSADPRIQPQVRSSGANAAVDEATINARIRQEVAAAAKAEAEAAQAGTEIAQTQQETLDDQKREQMKATRAAFKSDELLGTLRDARRFLQTQGGVGWEGLLANLPATDARRLRNMLDTLRSNLAFDRLQQMRDDSKTGGALGAVSAPELNLLESAVSKLDSLDSADALLESLDRVERSYIGAMMLNDGIDPTTDLGRGLMVDEFGYSGFFDGQPAEQFSLAQDNTASDAIPEAYQQEHLRYLRENWRNIKPEDYVAFRSRLDERFNLTPDLNAYENAAYDFNSFAAEGGKPEQLGVVPSPDREVGAVEGLLNQGAQTGLGTYFSQAGNAVTAGLLGQATGNQQEIELQRAARPGASFAGELTGGALGATALGAGGAAMAGGGRLASMIAGPYGADALHSTIYGGTQGGLEGAAYGLGGALAGGRLGQMIGRNIAPETFAPNAYRAAEDVVPTVPQLKQQSDELYRDVKRQGQTVGPQGSQDLSDMTRQTLARTGRVDGNGSYLLDDGPTTRAVQMLESFSGKPVSPQQAEQIRKSLSAGAASPVSEDRFIAGQLLEAFDDWAENAGVLPNAQAARDTSRRYIMGSQLQQREGIGVARGRRLKGNDEADTIRTQYGQLDEQVLKGNARFDPATEAAISKVAQGDPYTNTLRNVGKYGFGSVLPTTGMVSAGGNAAFLDGNPALMAIPAAIGATGSLARNLASRNTLRAAKEAELTALGGPEYLELIEIAKQQAANRSGNFFGGLFGAATSTLPRQ